MHAETWHRAAPSLPLWQRALQGAQRHLRSSAAVVVLVLVLLPFWTSLLVRTYAWLVLLQRKGLSLKMGTVKRPST